MNEKVMKSTPVRREDVIKWKKEGEIIVITQPRLAPKAINTIVVGFQVWIFLTITVLDAIIKPKKNDQSKEGN